jgi:hypothetical protein
MSSKLRAPRYQEVSTVSEAEPRLHHVPIGNVVPSVVLNEEGKAERTIGDLVRHFATTTAIPSRRTNKNRSGRRGVKQYHGRQWVAAVGGYDVGTSRNPNMAGMIKAINAPADKALCVTYEEWKARQ